MICLQNKNEIEAALRSNTFLHLYAIGDLDDFFWPHTTWYGLQEASHLSEVALVYTAGSLPVLLAVTEQPEHMRTLLQPMMAILPERIYAHLSGGLATAFTERYQVHLHGNHYKMGLLKPEKLAEVETAGVVQLTASDLPAIETLFLESYPGNWFEARMLETGQYYGLYAEGRLVSIAGVHVYSPRYRVAALGNITTHPDYRGKGLATRTCAKLCQELLNTVTHIGLNVKSDNDIAIACYEKLGFERIAEYGEYSMELDHTT